MDKILLIIKLIPALIELLKTIELLVPGQGKGEQKLAAVRQILEVTDSSLNSVWPTIANTITVLVSIMNSSKVLNPPVDIPKV